MFTNRLLPALALVTAVTLAACSVDAPLTAPSQRSLTPTVSMARSAEEEAQRAARKARRDSLNLVRDSIREDAKARRQALRDQLKLEKDAWKLFKKDLKAQLKLDKFLKLDLLRCEPQELDVAAEVIGPEGGSLHFGANKLDIPAGALDEDQLIVATAPMGELVSAVFAPHGLNFNRPAELTLSYKQCVGETEGRFQLAYVSDLLRILELPPSKVKKATDEVVGQIDHFSSYMIAY